MFVYGWLGQGFRVKVLVACIVFFLSNGIFRSQSEDDPIVGYILEEELVAQWSNS